MRDTNLFNLADIQGDVQRDRVRHCRPRPVADRMGQSESGSTTDDHPLRLVLFGMSRGSAGARGSRGSHSVSVELRSDVHLRAGRLRPRGGNDP